MVRILLDDLLNDMFVVVVPFCGNEDVRDKVVRCVRTKKMIGICIFEENPHKSQKKVRGKKRRVSTVRLPLLSHDIDTRTNKHGRLNRNVHVYDCQN